eukprot:CAMPEP_0117586966 /NCGR_PEP_ID=MMETSP0784-20121206/69019_1 /TAXON_ID=39447 /ORGANISM="" /LENGTH=603 /DNA_ID=CAMNT_0005388133 /DNA_START=15 /DNA_END=1826 /DNA_ORIENTATION=+
MGTQFRDWASGAAGGYVVNVDPKSNLNSTLQKLLGRPITKDDVQYMNAPEADTNARFTATVQIPAIEDVGVGVSFSGEVCVGKKAAEHSAAAAALVALFESGALAGAGLEEGPPKKKARTAAATTVAVPKLAAKPVTPGALGRIIPGHLVKPSPHFQKTPLPVNDGPKGMLNMLLGKCLARPPTKSDVSIEHEEGPDNTWFAKMILPEIGVEEFQGEAFQKKSDADKSAAAMACEALMAMIAEGRFPHMKSMPVMKAKAMATWKAESTPVRKKAKTGQSSVKAAAAAEPGSAEAEWYTWREQRLEACEEDEVQDTASLDFWYGQVCLVCQVICSKCSWDAHARGQKHLKKYEQAPLKLKIEVTRPPTLPSEELQPADCFLDVAGWAKEDDSGGYPAVLVVGEMDYSFSLAVAKRRPAGSPIMATSYLEEHDPSEPEVHPADDGERQNYRRRSLPAMNGALFNNLEEFTTHGGFAKHGVDAMDLAGTLASQDVEGGFHYVVFPFPRASLHRACNPANSRLLRDFFRSVRRDGFLMRGGVIQLVMLGTQYEEWDVAGMAADAGMALQARASLPTNFYQSREMSGKPWTPQGAELLNFIVADDMDS